MNMLVFKVLPHLVFSLQTNMANYLAILIMNTPGKRQTKRAGAPVYSEAI